MFHPDNRRNLIDLLRPPPGYRIDSAVTTTYSLDFIALTTVMLALVDAEPEDDTGPLNQIDALRAITRLSNRVRVFVNRGCIGWNGAPGTNKLCILFDSIVREVRLPSASFHPKVWLARYCPRELPRSEGLRPIVRLLCSSKNLTTSQFWEAFTCLEGPESDGSRQDPVAAQAADFVEQLFSQEPADELSGLVGSLRRAHFPKKGELRDGCDFLWQWPGNSSLLDHLPPQRERAVLVSPFVRKSFLQLMLDRYKGVVLVSTRRELDAIEDDEFHARLNMHDVFIIRPSDGGSDAPAMDLHAKILICEGKGRATTLIGSANAADSGWNGRNCEAMISCSPGVSARSFCDGFLRDDKKQLRAWVEPYTRRPPEIDTDDTIERELTEVRSALAQIALNASYQSAVQELLLSSPPGCASLVEPFQHTSIRVCPLSLLDVPGSWMSIEALFGDGLAFGGVSQADLSEFVAFELSHRQAANPVIVVIKAASDFKDQFGVRDAEVLKRLLSADKFQQFLRAILFDGARRSMPRTSAPGNGASPSWGTGVLAVGTLEEVLQSCTEDPTRVEEIDALLTAFKGTGFVDPTFEAFWRTVRAVIRPPRGDTPRG